MSLIPLENDALTRLMAENPSLQLLDVRTPQEYYGLGHIPGFRLLPIYELVEQLDTLKPDVPTVVLCEHGVRSWDAGNFLLHKGFKQVYNLTAGMAEWTGPREFDPQTTTN